MTSDVKTSQNFVMDDEEYIIYALTRYQLCLVAFLLKKIAFYIRGRELAALVNINNSSQTSQVTLGGGTLRGR